MSLRRTLFAPQKTWLAKPWLRLLPWILSLAAAESGRAQFTNPVTTTPAFLQDGFGPAGDQLAYGGQNYCVPTSVAMSLSYLGINGFNQLSPSTPTAASELNLVEVLSGLMATDPTSGTTPVNLQSGLATYLAAEGISTSNYTLTVISDPTVGALVSLDQPGTVVDLSGGYYNSSGVRTGGHCTVLLAAGVNAQGQSAPNTIAINNPLPRALAPDADLPGNSLQYLNTVPTSGNLTTDGAIELDPSQYPGFWKVNPLVIESATALTINPGQQSVNNPTIATWNLAASQSINLNNGTLPVLAPITGAGGIALGANGVLKTLATNTSSGANDLASGTWVSTITSGLPFGTGAMTVHDGTLALSPLSGSSNLSFTVASGAGNTFTFQSGATIGLSLNGNSSLTLTIGGNTDGTTPNLVRTNPGTLVLSPAGGTSDLGQNERIVVNGTGANLPQVTDGIVAPYIVSQNNNSSASGDFVTYGANGFVKATYTAASTTPIASAGTNSVFLSDIGQTVAANTAAQVYALNVSSAAISGGSSSNLEVGTQTGGQGGIIFDGGSISTTDLSFGTTEGVVYVSNAGGTISSIITGSGTRSLTVFGPGTLTLQGASTYTGNTNVNSGILQAQNTSGSATGTGNITVQSGGTLEISGAAAKAGGTGTTTVSGGAAVLLNGGTLAGTFTANAKSFLFGSGTISGVTTFSGIIGNSGTPASLPAYQGVEDITFTNTVTFESTAIYAWKLNALDANPADAGTDWSLLQFDSHNSEIGLDGSPFNFTIDFGSTLPDPNSGNTFWNSSHQWLVADDPADFEEIWWDSDFPGYTQGSFSLSLDSQVQDLYLNYTPAAAPEPGSAVLSGLGVVLLSLRRRREA